MTPAVTESALRTSLRAFLLSIAPAGTEVVKGNANRVPMPAAASIIVVTEMRRQPMAQTTHEYDDDAGTEDIARSTAIHYQLDVYGEAAADTAQVITSLFQDAYAADYFRPANIAPLFATEPVNLPLIAGEQQYIQRRTLTVALHANLIVTVPVEFADNLITTLVEVT